MVLLGEWGRNGCDGGRREVTNPAIAFESLALGLGLLEWVGIQVIFLNKINPIMASLSKLEG